MVTCRTMSKYLEDIKEFSTICVRLMVQVDINISSKCDWRWECCKKLKVDIEPVKNVADGGTDYSL